MSREGLRPEVATAALPLVDLLGEDHADQPDHAPPSRTGPSDRRGFETHGVVLWDSVIN